MTANVAKQIMAGKQSVIGKMPGSNINAGNQSIANRDSADGIDYGVSTTDVCVGWNTTEQNLLALNEKLKEVLAARTTGKSRQSNAEAEQSNKAGRCPTHNLKQQLKG